MRTALVLPVVLIWFAAQTCSAEGVVACLATDTSLDPASAVSACDALRHDPSLTDAVRAEVLVHLGIAARNLGDLAESQALLDQAVALRPGNGSHLRMLAWTLRESGDLVQSEALYTRSLALERHWQGYLSRCVVRQDLHEFRSAVEDCEAALALTTNGDTVYFTAHAWNRLVNHGRALDVALMGLLLPDGAPRIHAEAAEAYLGLGREADARRVLQDGLARWPDDPDLRWMLDSLP